MKEDAVEQSVRCPGKLGCMVEKACQQQVFSRKDTPTDRRVLVAFLYHAGLSDRGIEPFVDRSYSTATSTTSGRQSTVRRYRSSPSTSHPVDRASTSSSVCPCTDPGASGTEFPIEAPLVQPGRGSGFRRSPQCTALNSTPLIDTTLDTGSSTQYTAYELGYSAMSANKNEVNTN